MGYLRIARCHEHGLHGERTECFVCGGPVDQIDVVAVRTLLSDECCEAARQSMMGDTDVLLTMDESRSAIAAALRVAQTGKQRAT